LLPQLAIWRFIYDRAEISIWFYLYLSVVFMVIGHWELMVELKWENKNSNAGNSFVRLLVTTSILSSFWHVSIGVGLLQGQYPALWYVCFVFWRRLLP
jgi:UDP-N-acetylmuramyl pentapeptide phosphotransferase/UDP-N-acetylglucosamine-1-phosphate transferase